MSLAFVHIEKTGGTTLNQVLRRNFFLRFADVRPLSRTSKGSFSISDLRKYRSINPFLTAISGHSVRPLIALAGEWPNVRYVTLLREPARRYVSQYLYFVRIGERADDFRRFLLEDEFSNFQTKKLAESEDVDFAVSILDKMFAVGAVEEFDSFLLRLRKSLEPNPFDPRYIVRNASTGDVARAAELLGDYRSQIEERNICDRALYDHAVRRIIPRRNELYGDDLQQDLCSFAAWNEGFNLGFKDCVDFAFRKLYSEPVSGIVRRLNGLPAAGSY